MQQVQEVQRLKATAEQRARAVQTVLERVNPQREPRLHAQLFDAYIYLLREAGKEKGHL